LASKRHQGLLSVAVPLPLPIDRGTLSGQLPNAPGPVGVFNGPTTFKLEGRFVVPPAREDFVNELLIISGKEWLEFLTAVGFQTAPHIKDTLTNFHPALKKLGFAGKAALRMIDREDYVIISGVRGICKSFAGMLKGTKYLPNNLKVADLVISRARLARSVLESTPFSIVCVAATDVAQFVLEDKELLTRELGFTLTVDLTKDMIASIAGAIGVIGLSVILPTAWPILGGIFVGIAVGATLDHFCPTEKIVAAMNDKYEGLLREGGRFMYRLEGEIYKYYAFPLDDFFR